MNISKEDELLSNILESHIDKSSDEIEEAAEEFRIQTNSDGIFPIDLIEYRKIILVQGVSMDYLKDKIIEYGTLSGGRMVSHQIGIAEISGTNWSLVKCPEEMNFYNYHNMMQWFWGVSEDLERPTQNILVAVNKDMRYSYYAVTENLFWGDTLIGRFQNGESFSIYISEAFVEGGNAKECFNYLGEKDIDLYLKSCGFDSRWLERMEYDTFTYVDVEIVVE